MENNFDKKCFKKFIKIENLDNQKYTERNKFDFIISYRDMIEYSNNQDYKKKYNYFLKKVLNEKELNYYSNSFFILQIFKFIDDKTCRMELLNKLNINTIINLFINVNYMYKDEYLFIDNCFKNYLFECMNNNEYSNNIVKRKVCDFKMDALEINLESIVTCEKFPLLSDYTIKLFMKEFLKRNNMIYFFDRLLEYNNKIISDYCYNFILEYKNDPKNNSKSISDLRTSFRNIIKNAICILFQNNIKYNRENILNLIIEDKLILNKKIFITANIMKYNMFQYTTKSETELLINYLQSINEISMIYAYLLKEKENKKLKLIKEKLEPLVIIEKFSK